jgi:ribosomal protein S18 acetylase RimI-like enzyme
MSTPERPVVEVRDLQADDVAAVIGVLARGMRDNPMNVAILRGDPEAREGRLARMFVSYFRLFSAQTPLVAVDSGTIVGVTGVAPPGTYQASPSQQLRALPTALSFGPATVVRMLRALGGWGKRDITEPHLHLGPLAVDRRLQGKGIGTQILLEHTRRLDEANAIGYLETDKDINVRLYERFGYQVIGEGDVIGVHCWFMRRPRHSA